MANKEVPTGVKVLSIIYYIAAALSLIAAIGLFVGAGFAGGILSSLGIPLLAALGSGLFVAAGIFILIFAILDFFIGRGLWKAQGWARVLAIIFSALGALMGLMGLFSGSVSSIVGLIIHILVLWYLIFSKEVKNAFR